MIILLELDIYLTKIFYRFLSQNISWILNYGFKGQVGKFTNLMIDLLHIQDLLVVDIDV